MHDQGIHIALKAEVLGHIFGVPVTNTMLMSWVVMAVLIGFALVAGRTLTKIPGYLQTTVEVVFSTLLNYIEEVLESRTLALRFFPLLATLFFFILLGNLFGLIPGIGSITVAPDHHTGEAAHAVSLLYPMSVDLNVTLALALIAVLAIQIAGIHFLGFFTYLRKFINLRSGIGFFIGLIEMIAEAARVVSFSFRLFGNMFAGKTLILVAFFFAPYILPVPLMVYEVFVGLVQASIFTLLSLYFIKLALVEPH
jgi:F-type H+-transporting ATPase subunit a